MSAELFHAGLGWPIAAALLSVSFLGSFVTAAFGIGGGAVLIAVLATLLPASAIIPVHGLVQLGSNIGRAALMFQHIHRAVVLPFFVGSFVGVSLGSAFVVQLDAGMIQIGVGVFILWSILMKPPAIMRHSAGVSGAISSFLTMFFGATGPFIAAFLKTQKLERLGHTATHATLMSIQHALKTVAFGFLGFAFSVWAGLITLLVLSGFLGTIAGRYVLMRINENVFRFTLNLLLAILALRLIYYGSIAFLGG